MNCRHVENRLSAYLDGELTGEEMLLIRRHVSECQSCSSELESVRKTKLILSRLRTAIPRDELLGNIISQLDHPSSNRIGMFWEIHRSMFTGNYAKAGIATALCGLLLLALIAGNIGISNKAEYTEGQYMAMSGSESNKFVRMPNVPGMPYCISNDRPLQVVGDKSPYADGQIMVSAAVFSQ